MGERKIKGLLHSGASILLVAGKLTPWLQIQCDEGRLSLAGSDYNERHMENVDLVFAATNDPTLNRRIAEDAHRRRVWCNLATSPEEGSFIVPSIFHRGPLTIAISTSGLSPALARQIREKLEKEFDGKWAFYLELMGLLRKAIQSKGMESPENQRLFREVASLPLHQWMGEKRRDAAIDAIHRVCQPQLSLKEVNQLWDEAWKLSSSSSPLSVTSPGQSDT